MIFSEILPSFSYSLPLIAKEWKKDGRISEIIITNKIKKMKYFLLMSKITTSPTNREILLKVQVFVKIISLVKNPNFRKKRSNIFRQNNQKFFPSNFFGKYKTNKNVFYPITISRELLCNITI